jgi:hypothetical protein
MENPKRPGPPNQGLRTYTEILFHHLPPGVIEVRIIKDERPGKLVEKRWYEAPADLVSDLDELNRIATDHGAGVFVGVLPRKDRTSGKSANTLPGLTVWVDLDFKDFKGGEAEARERLGKFPVQPSMVVRSGHGLHAYWFLREPTDPETISALSKRLARALGGDHAFDAARILRLPGTWNRKDPNNPVPVEIELLEPERAYNPSEIAEALELVGIGDRPQEHASADDGEIRIGDRISARVQALIVQKVRVRSLFNGEGKPEVGVDGRTLDRTSSGYDYSLVLSLAKRGISDPSELATALWHRPDDAARSKGIDYVTRTVRAALDLVGASREAQVAQGACEIDFEVQCLRVCNSNPAQYEFTINGATFTVGSSVLKSQAKFAVAFMDALRRVPALPPKDEWRTVVNGWLAGAEQVEMPPEASDELALRESAESVIQDLPLGDAVEDLNSDKALALDDGRRGFKTAAVHHRLRDDYPHLKRNGLCKVLRDLGYSKVTARFGKGTAEVWTRGGPP